MIFKGGFIIPAGVLGGIKSGDRQRAIFGDMHMALLLANEARLLCDGLGVRHSMFSEDPPGDE